MARQRGNQVKPKKRRRALVVDERLKDAIPTTCSLSTDSLGDLDGNEESLKDSFPQGLRDVSKLFSELYTLHAVLIEQRDKVDDPSDLRSALDLLGTKGFADVRGAHILLERGYAMASLGPIRAAKEAADLMAYFLKHPEETPLWRNEDAKFESLSWVRKELPHDPTPTYDFLNIGLHPNWRLIPHLMSKQTLPTSTHFEIVVGPFRHPGYTEVLASLAAFELMRLIGALHDHRPDLVSDIWRDQFKACSRLNNQLVQKLAELESEWSVITTAMAEERLDVHQLHRPE